MNAVRSYRCKPNVKLPFEVSAQMDEIETTSVSYLIRIRNQLDTAFSTFSLAVKIPTPLNTTNVECKPSDGKAKYAPEENMVVWRWGP